MKCIAALALAIALSGCADYRAFVAEQQRRAAEHERQRVAKMNADDDVQCREYGLPKGTPAYADCRLRIQQMRSSEQAARIAGQAAVAAAAAAAPPPPQPQAGVPVYRASECIGPIIMGECHGTILAPGGPSATCHGKMLNGQCTGPMF